MTIHVMIIFVSLRIQHTLYDFTREFEDEKLVGHLLGSSILVKI